MNSFGEYRLGAEVAAPAHFRPDRSFSTTKYTYALDRGQGIARRTSPRSSASPTVYFQLKWVGAETNGRKTKTHKSRRWLSRLLVLVMIVAAFLLVYPFYPAVRYQAASDLGRLKHQPVALATVPLTSNNQLTIPAIGVQTPIVEGASIDVLLKHTGVWHQTGALPTGDLVLAGHRFRYLPPNTSTFYDLGQLQTGDQIIVDWYSKRYVYNVSSVTTIPATDTSFLLHQVPARIYLYTCQDWLMSKRILVVGTLVP